jgi:hypothetical protein
VRPEISCMCSIVVILVVIDVLPSIDAIIIET